MTEDKSHPSAANALKRIFDAAYQIQLNPATSSSIRHVFYERLRQFVQSLHWSSSTTVNKEWKREIASEMIRSLSASKLAKNILSQFKLKLQQAHENFLTSVRQLEQKHAERLEKMEKVRLSVRRQYAPKMAKLALESASTKDLILHGQPKLGKEIGRGQYGVVFACDSWAGFSPCAIKSVRLDTVLRLFCGSSEKILSLFCCRSCRPTIHTGTICHWNISTLGEFHLLFSH